MMRATMEDCFARVQIWYTAAKAIEDQAYQNLVDVLERDLLNQINLAKTNTVVFKEAAALIAQNESFGQADTWLNALPSNKRSELQRKLDASDCENPYYKWGVTDEDRITGSEEFLHDTRKMVVSRNLTRLEDLMTLKRRLDNDGIEDERLRGFVFERLEHAITLAELLGSLSELESNRIYLEASTFLESHLMEE